MWSYVRIPENGDMAIATENDLRGMLCCLIGCSSFSVQDVAGGKENEDMESPRQSPEKLG